MISNLRGAPDCPPEQPPEPKECGRCLAGDTKDGQTCTDCGGVAPEQPGFWAVTDEEYFADTKHVSNSALKCFSASVPRYYQTYITREIRREESDALRLGKAFHLMVLEPSKALDCIARAPLVDRRTIAGKAAWVDFVKSSAGKTILTDDEYDLLTAMRDGILTNPTTREILETPGMIETAFRWKCEDSGLWCKGKTDLVTTDFIVDVKTIDSLENWSKHVANYGYHRQQAFYQSGDQHIERFYGRDSRKEFVFVVVEKQAPFEAAAFTLSPETVGAGRDENLNALLELANCMKKNNWKSRYYHRITETSLPRWAMKGA